MFPSTSLLATCILALSTFVAATPSPRQPQCNPDFEGAPVTITIGNRGVKVAPPRAGQLLVATVPITPGQGSGNFVVTQTSPRASTYLINEVKFTDLVIDVTDAGLLDLEERGPSPTQVWEITCDECRPGASTTPGGGKWGSGCSIASAQTGQCVHIQPSGNPLINFGVGECADTADQSFDFWTKTDV
ncbi:hypothetical protein B0H15DRAFT_460589 [Mycena belliarum]|uniref:Uncharacterized protein n=1 Tax=Mycena belliarum TaxID=1033014 RepID=A0AAD6UGP9_9AGAR|nr:hypothetical protein B0H15DRAFT_460589 [Mycena belliae]